MVCKNVFLVGPRYEHYAAHSGYENVGRHCGMQLRAPVKHRFLSGRLGTCRPIGDIGWRIDQAVTLLSRRRLYGLGILLIETGAGLHMLSHRKSLYHVMYGETDAWLLSMCRRLSRNRLVATFHEPVPRLEWLRIDKLARHLDAVLPVSECQRAYFEQFLPAGRVFVVPHGIDTDFFKPTEKLNTDPICITVGSTLRDFKTLTAAITLVRRVNSHVRFIAVGARRSGGNKAQLQDDRVEFLDNLSDRELRHLYQQSSLAIFPFQYATANNALLEAMACGLPVVATNVGGVSEYLGDQAGILAEPKNPEDLAAGVLRLLEDSKLTVKLSQASRTRALQFDYTIVAERMRRVYSAVMKQDP